MDKMRHLKKKKYFDSKESLKKSKFKSKKSIKKIVTRFLSLRSNMIKFKKGLKK